VAAITVGLRRDDSAALEKETHELARQRQRSQPGGRNAGCVFKNTKSAPAGRLIDEIGLKGVRRGGAVVSPRHANFVVNDGAATASDVLDLVHYVHECVARETGVDLELEVKVWRPRS
jgi:UDP-N-acetylmuramate dehydrogenase